MSSEKKCAVPGCSFSGSDIRLYKFPEQNSLINFMKDGICIYFSQQKIWLEKLGLPVNFLVKNAFVCHSHFRKEDFTTSEEGDILLKQEAVPLLNLPSYLDKSCISRVAKENHGINFGNLKTDYDDDDDDVEIIEPKREIITLDDDDDDEVPPKSNNSNEIKKIPEIFNGKTIKIKRNLIKVPSIPKMNVVNHSPFKKILPKKLDSNGKPSIVTATGEKFIIQSTAPCPIPIGHPILTTNELPVGSLVKNSPRISPPSTSSPRSPIPIHSSPSAPCTPPVCSIPPVCSTPPVSDPSKPISSTPKTSSTSVITKEKSPDNQNGCGFVKIPFNNAGYQLQLFQDKKGPPMKDKEIPVEFKEHVASIIQRTNASNETLIEGLEVITPDGTATKENMFRGMKPNQEHKSWKPNMMETLDLTIQGEDNVGEKIGFTEMYNYIQSNIINFTYAVFGRLYTIEECNLKFQPVGGMEWDRKQVVISENRLDCNDELLMTGMKASIQLSEKFPEQKGQMKATVQVFEKDPQQKLVIKKIGRKYEVLTREKVNAKLETEQILKQLESELEMKRQKSLMEKMKYVEEKVSTEDKEMVIIRPREFVKLPNGRNWVKSPNTDIKEHYNSHPKRQYNNTTQQLPKNIYQTSKPNPQNILTKINIPCMSSTYSILKPGENHHEDNPDKLNGKMEPILIPDESDENSQSNGSPEPSMKDKLMEINKNRRLVKHKRNMKLSLARSRKVLPVSQMNPKLNMMFGSRIRKGKRPMRVLGEKKEKKELIDEERLQISSRGDKETKDSPSKEDEQKNKKADQEKTTVRRPRRSCTAKKDYREFNEFGTSPEKDGRKRKKSVKISPIKKTKFSDKVGHIESFLEVVLEPDSKELLSEDETGSMEFGDIRL